MKNYFRLIFTTLMLSLLLQSTVTFANTQNFKDVPSRHWALRFIDSLKATEIVTGYPDGTFRPSANVKANEYIAMTVKALGYSLPANPNDWAKPYIDKALELHLIAPEQFKNYNDFITRQSMVSITMNAISLNEERPSTEFDQFVANDIKDFIEICDRAKQNVLDAYKMGVVTGYTDKTFRGWNFTNRAEATTLISKIINPSLRDNPKLDYKATVKHWYWVKKDGTRVFAETNIYKNGVFQLVDEDFYMPVYKGINVTELFEIGKYLNKLTLETGNEPFYLFSLGQDGFGVLGFKNKNDYIDIFKNNILFHDQTVMIPTDVELIVGAAAYLYADYSYSISLDKVNYDKYRSFIEKMIQFSFKADATKVIEKINNAIPVNDIELIKFGIGGRNVKISNTGDRIKIEYSVKYK
ncbi:MAG TPA: hypothetical protein DCS67_03960 [Clostridiales bacterium UBA8960]|nr:hypothetical protein [Clostridiales bacterium UBA8960]